MANAARVRPDPLVATVQDPRPRINSKVLPEPFTWVNGHIRADLPHGHALFSTRAGGVSTGPYESLNLGLLTDDAPAHVSENRCRLAAAVGVGRERFLYGKQVHGAKVRRATEPPGPTR